MPTRKRKAMKKFEVTICYRRYERHIVEAENEGDAIEIANYSEPVEVGIVDEDQVYNVVEIEEETGE
jgi:hypothetical protein